jgi:hypothetical protein
MKKRGYIDKEEEISRNQIGEGDPSLREASFEELKGKGELYSPLEFY